MSVLAMFNNSSRPSKFNHASPLSLPGMSRQCLERKVGRRLGLWVSTMGGPMESKMYQLTSLMLSIAASGLCHLPLLRSVRQKGIPHAQKILTL
jgi:hypothetical protein